MASASSSTANGLTSTASVSSRGTGEPAQDQDPVLIVAAGHEFLGDQVHPVVQRADDAEPRQPMQRHHLDLVEVPLLEHDRLPRVGSPLPVDLFDQFFDLGIEPLILTNMTATGRSDLYEDQPAAILGPVLEEAVDGAEPLGDPLGVIEPLDPDAQDLPLEVQSVLPAPDLAIDFPAAASAECRSKSMLIGKGRTWVVWPPRFTSLSSRSVRASRLRSTVSRKF